MPIGATIGAAAIGAGGTLLASHAQSSAINNATDAQTAAYNKALDLQQQQYNQQRQDYAPWRAVGLGALSQLAQTENIKLPDGFFQGQIGSAVSTANGQTTTGTGTNSQAVDDYARTYAAAHGGQMPPGYTGHVGATVPGAPVPVGSGTTVTPTTPAGSTTATPTTPPAGTPAPGGQFGAFYASPDYQFRVDQGTRAITGNKAAAGLLDAGSTGQGLINYGQQAGSQEFGNWYNRIAALAGVGQTATEQSTAAGQAATNNMTGLISQQGNSLASSYLNKGQVSAGLIGNLGGIAGGLVGNMGGMFGGGFSGGSGVGQLGGNGGGGMNDSLFGSPI